MLGDATYESPLSDELVLSEVSASLEVLVSPDESSVEDDPPPPPPPPQEITRRLKINTIGRKRIFFIISLFLVK